LTSEIIEKGFTQDIILKNVRWEWGGGEGADGRSGRRITDGFVIGGVVVLDGQDGMIGKFIK
jgi:hypothetical protein